MMRLFILILMLSNSLVLKDKAWYSDDKEHMKRLNHYVLTGHATNVQHMSQAGMFKANIGTKSIDGSILVDECPPLEIVEFNFKNDSKIYYTTIWDVQPTTQLHTASLDVQAPDMLQSDT